MIPFLIVEFLVIFLISYFPILTMAIPNWLGYLDVPAAASWILGGIGG